ncbi:MAG: hypothetical protein IJO27_05010 [Bacilli bacterium]|nr:hypothetical protein [Erysipelotrichaceae bacterium]MBQ6817773.1 hypothetical protein [Bacilli bacterium]
MGKILGIDQGITTVGWGIIDTDKGDVIDAGVRLFPEGDKTNSFATLINFARLKRVNTNAILVFV